MIVSLITFLFSEIKYVIKLLFVSYTIQLFLTQNKNTMNFFILLLRMLLRLMLVQCYNSNNILKFSRNNV